MYKWLQECLVCNYKAEVSSEKREDEDIIRAACLPCGHQGLFKLKLLSNKENNHDE